MQHAKIPDKKCRLKQPAFFSNFYSKILILHFTGFLEVPNGYIIPDENDHCEAKQLVAQRFIAARDLRVFEKEDECDTCEPYKLRIVFFQQPAAPVEGKAAQRLGQASEIGKPAVYMTAILIEGFAKFAPQKIFFGQHDGVIDEKEKWHHNQHVNHGIG